MSKTVQWILLILIGGLSGIFIGELLAAIVPNGLLKDILSKTIDFGLNPPGTLDIKFLSLTLGFQFRMSLFGLLGLGAAFYLGKHLH